MSRSVKAQAMIEYVTYFGISFLFFLVMLIYIYYFDATQVQEAQFNSLNNRATELQTLFYTYSQMNPDFTQTVSIEETLNGHQYNFEILASNLYVSQNDLEIIVPLPEINGNTTNKVFNISVLSDGVHIS